MSERKPITREMARKYRGSDKRGKSEILDTVVELTGYSRHYAGWLLRHHGRKYWVNYRGTQVHYIAGIEKKRTVVSRPRVYDDKVQSVLSKLWASFDYMSGQRLSAMLKDIVPVMRGTGELTCSEEVAAKLLAISGASIDRLLADEKHRMRGRNVIATNLLRRSLRIHRFDAAHIDKVMCVLAPGSEKKSASKVLS